jgi:hypothetical protein
MPASSRQKGQPQVRETLKYRKKGVRTRSARMGASAPLAASSWAAGQPSPEGQHASEGGGEEREAGAGASQDGAPAAAALAAGVDEVEMGGGAGPPLNAKRAAARARAAVSRRRRRWIRGGDAHLGGRGLAGGGRPRLAGVLPMERGRERKERKRSR